MPDDEAALRNEIIALAKLFDPTSVVRSEEGKAVELTGNLPSTLRGQFLYLIGEEGSRLDPSVRKGMIEEARSRMAAYNEAWQRDKELYTGIIRRAGLNPQDFLPSFEDVSATDAGGRDLTDADENTKPEKGDYVLRRSADGKTHRWVFDGEGWVSSEEGGL